MGLKAGTAIAGFCTRHGLPPPSVRALQDFACECSAHLAEVSVTHCARRWFSPHRCSAACSRACCCVLMRQRLLFYDSVLL